MDAEASTQGRIYSGLLSAATAAKLTGFTHPPLLGKKHHQALPSFTLTICLFTQPIC